MIHSIKVEDDCTEFLTEDEICELREAFNIFDVDSDGSIEVNQLSMLLNSLKQYPTKEELTQILKDIENDNPNKIYFNQFLKILSKLLKSKNNDDNSFLKKLFLCFDRNKNGLISIHEIRHIVSHSKEKLSEKEIEFIMKEVDTDEDGYISFEEFMTIMKD